jgi:ribosomal-protein-alanine N-acetyltransferase
VVADLGISSTRIRIATQNDLAAINRIENGSFVDPYPRRLLARLLSECPDSFLVAESEDGTIVGYCVASQEVGIVHLLSVAVLLEHRRRGIGSALIRKLIVSMSPASKEMVLEVKVGNSEAIKLYEALGFKRLGVIEHYYSDGASAVKMRRVTNDSVDGGGPNVSGGF